MSTPAWSKSFPFPTLRAPRAGLTCLSLVLMGMTPAGFANSKGTQENDTVQQKPSLRIVEGGKATLGAGTARTWAEVDAMGKPLRVLLSIPDEALALGHDATEHVLRMPRVGDLPFQNAVINWMPHGHDPQGIFNVPHFDVHFYMMSEADRRAITLDGDSLARAQVAPEPRFIPEGFVSSGMAEPGMGMHWIDPSAPEFNGQPFKASFIYGFYDGKMNFMEVMLAKAFLETKPNVWMPIAQPAAYPLRGRYPTTYAVRHDAKERQTLIILKDFAAHK